MPAVRTPFSPTLKGLHFVNSFNLLPQRRLPKIGALNLDALKIIGLCGGMCFAALDYFHSGRAVPEILQVSDLSPTLLRYLKRRQSDSVPLSALLKLSRWVLKDDLQVGLLTVGREVPLLKQKLDQGQPVVLLLVCTRGTENPTLNHQVVATGYDFDPAAQKFKIFLYDPNHPGVEPSLTLSLADPAGGIHLTQSTGEARRGFFVQNYNQTSLESRIRMRIE